MLRYRGFFILGYNQSMTAPYKKRMKGNWNQGKGCKGDSEEREYAKEEIRQAVKEMDEDYVSTYKKSKRVRNEKARLEHRIKWCLARIEFWRKHTGKSDWISNWIRDTLRESREKYEKLFGELPDELKG